MREIKFRSYDKEKKQMYYDFDQENKEVLLGKSIHHFVYNVGFINETLMQFTGIKDENGNDIYEGDIINYGYYEDINEQDDINRPMNFVVKWSIEECSFMANGRLLNKNKIYSFPIIGNIHENPELL